MSVVAWNAGPARQRMVGMVPGGGHTPCSRFLRGDWAAAQGRRGQMVHGGSTPHRWPQQHTVSASGAWVGVGRQGVVGHQLLGGTNLWQLGTNCWVAHLLTGLGWAEVLQVVVMGGQQGVGGGMGVCVVVGMPMKGIA